LAPANAQEIPPQEPPVIPVDLPDADWVISRSGASSSDVPNIKATYEILSVLALEWLSGYCGIPFPITQFLEERLEIRDYYPVSLLRNWPVVSLTQVLVGDQRMRIGTARDVEMGRADVSIDGTREGLRFGSGWGGWGYGSPAWGSTSWGGRVAFVDYTAGYGARVADPLYDPNFGQFPKGLLDTYAYLVMLMSKEPTRVGLSSSKIDVAETRFLWDLPAHLQAAVRKFRRSQINV
jgi:hypothetical protein